MAGDGGMAQDSMAGEPTWLPRLHDDEYLVWAGRPSLQPFALRGRDAMLLPFTFIWAAFAFSFNVLIWRNGPSMPALFTLPFLLIGLYLVLGRFIHNWWLRNGTYYALSNRRAFILRGGIFSTSVAERFIDSYEQIESSMHRDGRGTIRFGEQNLPSMFNRNNWQDFHSAGVEGFQFWKIVDAQNVLDSIRSIQQETDTKRRRARQQRPLGNASGAPTPADSPTPRQPDDRDHDPTWDRFAPEETDPF